VIKPNIGGSGAGIERFNTEAEFARGRRSKPLVLGIDSTALGRKRLRRATDYHAR